MWGEFIVLLSSWSANCCSIFFHFGSKDQTNVYNFCFDFVVSAVDGGQLRGDGSKQVGSHKMVKIGKIYSLKSFLLRFEPGIKSKNLLKKQCSSAFTCIVN